jgi:hypothetical protein
MIIAAKWCHSTIASSRASRTSKPIAAADNNPTAASNGIASGRRIGSRPR